MVRPAPNPADVVRKNRVYKITGGGQEDNRRAGTENTAAIAGLAEAMRIAASQREADIMEV